MVIDACAQREAVRLTLTLVIDSQMHRPSLLAAALIVALFASQADGQFRPISFPGFFTALRYQNSACDGDNEESGVCLYEVCELERVVGLFW